LTSYAETTVGLPGERTRTQNYGYDGFGNWWIGSQAHVPAGVNVPNGSSWYNIGGQTTNPDERDGV
jgi:hypothetical protein